MGISTFDEATRPGGTGYVVTFYRLNCPKCGTVSVGDSLHGGDSNRGWQPGHPVHCRCGYWTMPETRKVDLAA